MKKHLILIITLLTSAPINAAELNDGDDLYEKAGPNSAFVRVVSLSEEAVNARVASDSISIAQYCGVSKTVIVESGPLAIEGNGWQWQQKLEAGQIYTLAVTNDTVIPFMQSADRNPLRAKFEVFNLSGAPDVTVRTSEKKQAVFTNINSATREERELNPLRVNLEIATENTVLPLEPIAFSRGRTTSMMICDNADEFAVAVVTE